MTNTETGQAASPAEAELHDHSHGEFGTDRIGRLLFWIAVVFSLYQIATAAHVISLPSQVVRAFHVGFLTLLVFPLVAQARDSAPMIKALAWTLALAGVDEC